VRVVVKGIGTRIRGGWLVAFAVVCVATAQAQPADRRPVDVALVLAARYPAAPSMSYIPALAWAGALQLSARTGDATYATKARREMEPFLTGAKPAIAEPYLLTSLAGHLAFSALAADAGEARAAELAVTAADFILPTAGDKDLAVRFGRQWTDDMFMASAILSPVAARTKDPKYAQSIGRLLTSYAEKLQRRDGLFIHALDGPHAWGRGNGFAAFGLVVALEHLPASWPDRSRVLEIYRAHMRALLAHQSDEGSWRQVVDEPASYRELTVTAMTVTAMARGVRLGWLDKSYVPHIERGWRAVSARVSADGAVADVCSGTGAGPTKEYYLNRPAVSGGDDRGGAMALVAALEMSQLSR
jgi:unsaturated rhamnogalacturonyl hydrolase